MQYVQAVIFVWQVHSQGQQPGNFPSRNFQNVLSCYEQQQVTIILSPRKYQLVAALCFAGGGVNWTCALTQASHGHRKGVQGG